MEAKPLSLSLLVQVFWILGALLLAQSLAALYAGFRFLRFVRAARRPLPNDFQPYAAVIIPCQGLDTGFDAVVTRFLSQDYLRYQVIFVVASDRDPAYAYLQKRLRAHVAPGAARSPETALVVAGYAEGRGDKVHNLLKGVEAADPGAEILVFADADARPAPDWLRSLVAPLADAQVTVSTGFRWYLPGTGFASQLRAAWDTSIATMLGDHDHNFAWGGSMAIRAADFRRLEIAERHWANTVSDDYALTRAVREARGKIRFQPRCLVASGEELPLQEFWRWSNRQIAITRVYAPHLWRLGILAHTLYCGTLLLGLVLCLANVHTATRLGMAAILLAILALGVAKGYIRTIVARELFPEEGSTLERLGGRYCQLAVLVPWVMFLNFLVAGFTRKIEWRGTHYELRSRTEVRVLRRDGL